MSHLTRHAAELAGVLHGIVHCLRASGHRLGATYAGELAPMVDALDAAVFESCDRVGASRLMSEIDPLMNNINRSATLGGLEILATGSDLSAHYWELNTIFRETRYRDQQLIYDRSTDSRSSD